MYGDFSRLIAPGAHVYDSVWFQQGRVQLDSDHNDATAVIRDWLRTLTQDMVGPFGGQGDRAGFGVALTHDGEDLELSPGHYYVFGARCVLPAAANGRPITYRGLTGRGGQARPLPKAPYLVLLQVWDDSVSATADPGLLEPGLGPNPPDTTVRVRTRWRPRIECDIEWVAGPPVIDGSPQPVRAWVNEVHVGWSEPGHRPRLQARVPEAARRDASLLSPSARYRGVENQLYRVEIHRPGRMDDPEPPTFVWSRDNGSVSFGIEKVATTDDGQTSATAVTVTSLGRDAGSSVYPGDWLEVVDSTAAPFGEPPPLVQVLRVDPDARVVTVDGDVQVDLLAAAWPRPILRRWDQPVGRGDANGIPIRPSGEDDLGDGWTELEDGVQVRFPDGPAPDGPAHYRRGDFWLIPARTATGSVQWPTTPSGPAALEPWGPARRYAPLALVTAAEVVDLRTLFVPLAFPDVDAAFPELTPGSEPVEPGSTSVPEAPGSGRTSEPPTGGDDG